MRILLFRGGALGDFILTLPLIDSLRQHWPGAHIALVGNKAAASLALHTGQLDEVISQHDSRWAGLYSPASLAEPLRNWLNQFDLVLNFWPDRDGTLARHLASVPRPRTIHLEAHPAFDHATEHFCRPLAELGIHISDTHALVPTLRLKTPHPGPFVGTAFHPGSGSETKNWPASRWNSLIPLLDRPVLVGSHQDEEAISRITSESERAIDLPLLVLAQTLEKARLYIGHDTGVSHLAAAVGTPSVVLFGPTNPDQWAPKGEHVRVLRAQPLGQLTAGAVMEAGLEVIQRCAERGAVTDASR